ncbi:uncharacterized protein LOC113853256 [Abrus precatorius]|uniref:Uncharacterized protein LOC113853256 n=1 Tax=Abrus precatorius TaxID=3816 RepID=A0A8B8K7B2_ABRPR|nr:uncharacterized protein LOC113853256 [Abrus precatorius]
MKGTLFLLPFVIILGLSHLACYTAVPITRTKSLMQDAQVHLALDNLHKHKVITGIKWHREEPIMAARMGLELNDYPPSGANGRHTPRAP